jgi:two-component system LytT family response regulator
MTALIIDDERIARQELRRLLAAHPDIEIAGEASSGPDALDLIRKLEPDLIFLDIQMPGMTGFELLEALGETPVPQVIFTTAYDEFALRAFEVNALDYLLKPVAPERLAAALARLRPAAGTKPKLAQVFVRDGERCWLVRIADIALLESEGNYTRLYFGKERPLIPRSLAALEQRLESARFFRADRKYLINLDWVERVETGVSGNLVVALRNGVEVAMSRRQSARLKDLLSL